MDEPDPGTVDAAASRVLSSHETTKTALWICLLAGASVLFSLALACAAPLVALGCLAALTMTRRAALLSVGMAWAANQIVGYALLGYPTTVSSFGWGVAIGIAAVGVSLAAVTVSKRLENLGRVGMVVAGFCAAFLVYEGLLYAATFVLPSSATAFSLSVILFILKINAVAFAGLLLLNGLALQTGFLSPRIGTILPRTRPA